jgi:hypothetical protein
MAKSKNEKPESTPTVKSEVVQALKVEINFPSISGIKLAQGFNNDGDFQIGIQFTAKVNPFEVFRLINLLKGPHTALYAVIGSNQGILDFKFDEKNYLVEVVKAAAQLAAGETGKPEKKDADDKKPAQEKGKEPVVKGKVFVEVHSNDFPDEPEPFGLFAEYLNGSQESRPAAGRGKSPSEAAMALLRTVNIITSDRPAEPFEAIKYLTEDFGSDPYCLALADVIKSNTFEPLSKVANHGAKTEAAEKPKGRRRKAAGEDSTKGV